jgi:hypothetical protein
MSLRGGWNYCNNELKTESSGKVVSISGAGKRFLFYRCWIAHLGDSHEPMNVVGTGEYAWPQRGGHPIHIMARAQRDPHHCRHKPFASPKRNDRSRITKTRRTYGAINHFVESWVTFLSKLRYNRYRIYGSLLHWDTTRLEPSSHADRGSLRPYSDAFHL